MKSSGRKIELASASELFSTEQERQDAKLERLQHIPLSELYPFPDHPFSVKDDDSMRETVESIMRFLSTRLKPKPSEVYDVYEVDVSEDDETAALE